MRWLRADPRNRIFTIMFMFVFLEFLAIFYVIGFENNLLHPGAVFLNVLMALGLGVMARVAVMHARSRQRVRHFLHREEQRRGTAHQ
ncbi:unnamed protein product, partial [Heterosigma akashiwo]